MEMTHPCQAVPKWVAAHPLRTFSFGGGLSTFCMGVGVNCCYLSDSGNAHRDDQRNGCKSDLYSLSRIVG